MTDFPQPSGPEQQPPVPRAPWSREYDQVQATVQALQGAASLLQGAMEQRQELMSEVHSAEQSLAVLQHERAQAEHALANTTSQLERAAREVEQVRSEQTGVVAEFDKLVQGALARRSALVSEIADLERQRDTLAQYAPAAPAPVLTQLAMIPLVVTEPPPAAAPPIAPEWSSAASPPIVPEWLPVANAWLPPPQDMVAAPTPLPAAPVAPLFAAEPIAMPVPVTAPTRHASPRLGLREVATVLIGMMLVGLAVLLTPVTQVFGGTQLLAVMSGSMEPTIRVGGIVAVRPAPVSTLQVGDVITFANQSNPDVLITHRIVSLEPRDSQTLITTKGDANDSIDAVAVAGSRAVGRVDFTLPWLGYLMVWLASPLAKVGILLVSVIGFALPSTRRKPAPAAEIAAPPVPIFAAVPTPSYAAFEREIEALLPRAS